LKKQFDANGQTVYTLYLKKTTTTLENKIIVDLKKINDSTLWNRSFVWSNWINNSQVTPDNGLTGIQ
jgi:hypothetical protein